jgi:acetolactate synthase I/II/III large subunit
MNGAQALFKALTDAGLDTCFANPGTSEMHLVYEIGRTPGVRAVLCLQENTVTGAADGYARMAGKPAFTLLHVGSGFANSIANLHNAGRASTPMVNVVGANATYHQPNFCEHELINGRIADLARPVSHWTQEARNASELGLLAAQAAQHARMGAGKICTLIAPTDCQWDPALAPPAPLPAPERLQIAREVIEDVAALLVNGKKTGLLLGSYALHGEGLELGGRIAAQTGVDLLGEMWVARLARGAGRVPVRIVPYLREHAAFFLQGYEQLILLGAQLPMSTFAYHGAPLNKVPASCQVTTLATVEHDLLAVLRQLAESVGAPAEPALRTALATAAAPSGALSADAIGQSLCLLMPEDAILVNDGATCSPPIVNRTAGARAHDYLDGSRGGALGGGLPLALGAAIACPDRKTILLQGDGSGMYASQALWSMARERADVVVIVLRNDNYAILEVELARVREQDANDKMLSMMHLDDPALDWVKIAEGHGVAATRATTAEEFHAQFEAACRQKGPCLIEAKVTDSIAPFVAMIRGAR